MSEDCSCTGRCPDTGLTLTELLARARDAEITLIRTGRGLMLSWDGGGHDLLADKLLRHEPRILRFMEARHQKRIA
jgi:hypothetical protein